VKLRMEDDRRERDAVDFDIDVPRSGFSGFAASIGARNLMIIIVTMPLVFLMVVMGVIAVFGEANETRETAAPGAVRSTSAAAPEAPAPPGQRTILPIPAAMDTKAQAIELPAGARAGAISLDGERLAVRVDAEDGAMIFIYDLTKNAVVQTVPLKAAEEN